MTLRTAYSVAMPVAADTKTGTVTFTGISSGVTWSATDSMLFFSGTIDITVGTFCEAKQGTFHRV